MPEMNSKENWNKFILENQGSFLQSWEWGEFQKKLGRKIFRLGFGGNEFAVGQEILVLPRGANSGNSKFETRNSKHHGRNKNGSERKRRDIFEN